MAYSITKDGKPLDKSLYTIDEDKKVFSSDENSLVLDFSGESGWTFKTGSFCVFRTGSSCTFSTGSRCTFNTGSNCTFSTSSRCTFKTGSGCTFSTGSFCVFRTGSSCTFSTGFGCNFFTGLSCTFATGSHCTFKTDARCMFSVAGKCKLRKIKKECVALRWDTWEIINLPVGKTIKLNYETGYKVLKNKKKTYTLAEIAEKLGINPKDLVIKK